MQFYMVTDKGLLREINEDFCLSGIINGYTVLILADGMGGHNGGETASKIAGEFIFGYLKENLKENMLPGQIMLMLPEAFEKANSRILRISEENPELSGMGTTADVLIYKNNVAYIAHIGDGRIYTLSPKGELHLITKDHSLVEYMIETGAITREQAAGHPQKNIITKALGISRDVDADVFRTEAEPCEFFLMCSDGLTNMVSEETMAKTILSGKNVEKTAKKLIKLANSAGGNDNITVILAKA